MWKKNIRVNLPIRSGSHSTIERSTAEVSRVDDGLAVACDWRPIPVAHYRGNSPHTPTPEVPRRTSPLQESPHHHHHGHNTRAAALSSPPARTPLRQVHDMLGIMPRSVAALYFNAHPEVEACVPREAYAPFCPPKYMARSGGARADVPRPSACSTVFSVGEGWFRTIRWAASECACGLIHRPCASATLRRREAAPTDFVAPAKEHAGAGSAPSISSQFHAELREGCAIRSVAAQPARHVATTNRQPSGARVVACRVERNATM